ncbi:recombinase family protein [Magnetospira sp. QH-2]|uniref:recombinase family protein n=1 Tax=Magnetospira sp. (strain QH-2) TaxID=1288970 RepID=UPI0003E80B3B|nr:recombinase family protein [Magnetospira sp. QH-2]CCQ73916.1 Site-specific recombinase (resolvase) [Magnetospira sp. QH-2]
MDKFIAYYRVSTKRQGHSGLGLEAQQTAVKAYLEGKGWPPVEEFTEVESGKKADRPELGKALTLCRIHGATLVIAKLDRLSRNAAFLMTLRDSGVKFVAADMPDATHLTVGIMAVVAQDEAERISARTKAALAAAKERGTELGGFRGYVPTDDDRTRATEAKKEKARAWAADLLPIIEEIRATGVDSLGGIARALNDRRIPTARGGRWQAVQVKRVLESG